MRIFDVTITEEAEADLISIVKYLNNFSPSIGERYYTLIGKKIKSLRRMPQRCSLVHSKRLRYEGVRWIYAKNYVVFFVIDEKKNIVDVKRILHALQEYDVLL